jgi:hypothetical protein
MKRAVAVFALAATAAGVLAAQTETLDYETIGRIRDEGLNRSQVMDHISWLSDVYGPRLSGSPAIQQASEWAMKKFAEWGLANVHQERFQFGRGWSLVRFHATMLEPQAQPIIGYPRAWTSSTAGTVAADVVMADIQSEADFERYRGKLAGKIVLTQPAREVRMLEGPIILRMTEQDLAEARTTPVPAARGGGAGRGRGGRGGRAGGAGGDSFRQKLADFYRTEKVVALFDRGGDSDMSAGGSDLSWRTQRTDGGTLFPGSDPRGADAGAGIPGVTLAVEHYNRMVRILEKGVAVKVELNVEARFHDETAMNGFNTIAELPGTDLASEIVLLGAHFDSTHGATGATDNATGSAAMMEAVRILKAIGARPRRTIRVALWGAEEQGLMGSRAYVREHLAEVETMTLKPGHAKVSAYFNSDNGTGRVRGIWLQSNFAVRPIFEQWIEPLRDLGVTTVGPRSVSQTDHVSFDNVGVPAFQFMVDRLEYNSRTHHSTMDVFDRVQREDMVQQATVVAVFAYNAAMRAERLPRKALPGRRGADAEQDSRRPQGSSPQDRRERR